VQKVCQLIEAQRHCLQSKLLRQYAQKVETQAIVAHLQQGVPETLAHFLIDELIVEHEVDHPSAVFEVWDTWTLFEDHNELRVERRHLLLCKL